MKHKLRLWYHQRMVKRYGKLADSVKEDPEDGMTERGELEYLHYFGKMIHHKAMVRELQEGA